VRSEGNLQTFREDFLGLLHELGIAAEFSLFSLSALKRHLKGKKNAKSPNTA